jgi:hypothetical protein
MWWNVGPHYCDVNRWDIMRVHWFIGSVCPEKELRYLLGNPKLVVTEGYNKNKNKPVVSPCSDFLSGDIIHSLSHELSPFPIRSSLESS